ncbi:MAG: hypothetical protein LIP03_06865 [Bacteroidales bacterium]|nr:hypothetical protein [Bacteroidales bacterium]
MSDNPLYFEASQTGASQARPRTAAGRNRAIDLTAKWLSAVFSPLLVPTYACAIALWITPLSVLSERIRLSVSLIVFAITALVPLGAILFLMRSGKVADPAISNRRERDIPYMITGLCYIGAALVLAYMHASHWLTFFYAGATFAVIAAVVINTWWKISAHTTTFGGLTAMVFFIAYHGYGIVWMMPWLSVVILLAGAIGSARLYLKRHSDAQVYAGFAMGFIVEYVFMSF